MANREGIRAEIEPIFLKAKAVDWIKWMNDGGVPAGTGDGRAGGLR